MLLTSKKIVSKIAPLFDRILRKSAFEKQSKLKVLQILKLVNQQASVSAYKILINASFIRI
ncbi:hypothetical protein BpHYR1_051181 [Brachionus plicatilis]|uniref:Uncharacterized protein n=1 Tax=Brachionus plicatilis TaxID=10195 RepID=A0A3M7S1H1_BRAPC|nr:hypothetical protein BpHYR1_051181 [Brachionus plicatilis]